jgi:hypothetical protein
VTVPGDSEALAAAKGLTGALTDMTAELQRLAAYGHRNRRMIWGLIISIILDLVLTVTIAIVAVQAHDANTAAAAAKQSELALCTAGNAARAQQVTLWTHLLTLPRAPGSPPRTKAQQQEISAFGVYVKSIFHPRDCAHLGRKG